jgi:hypothetical protein
VRGKTQALRRCGKTPVTIDPSFFKESRMSNYFFQKAVLISILTGMSLAIGCGGGVEGKYADPSNQIIAEFKDGKAYIALGGYAVTGTYKIDGKKIIARGDFGLMIPNPCVFTINDDGTIMGRKDTFIPRLEKVKK